MTGRDPTWHLTASCLTPGKSRGRRGPTTTRRLLGSQPQSQPRLDPCLGIFFPACSKQSPRLFTDHRLSLIARPPRSGPGLMESAIIRLVSGDGGAGYRHGLAGASTGEESTVVPSIGSLAIVGKKSGSGDKGTRSPCPGRLSTLNAPLTKADDKSSDSAYSDELKPDCNQAPRLITGQCLSLRARLHGQVCSGPDVILPHRAGSYLAWRARQLRGGPVLGPMSGRRAKLPGSAKDANSLGPRHNRVEVLPQSTLRSFDSCDSVARPGRPANALCQGLGPDFFFPTSSVGLARAERICAGCPVAAECLAVALDDLSLHGIWAGTSARERQYLRSEEGLGWG